ncbi:hypothetical protein K457DRAFT_36991 [Linnemannia elongata AG-77]|uniref:Uncharacterized protein n=1 Tax=Linnemannia elongata AG-77 TaxID=1314771 RepID=A0A197JCF3_9FUNG|nr:hypothetical protein K457DRAFT_36991 [Linnemannia elongata AG-77]
MSIVIYEKRTAKLRHRRHCLATISFSLVPTDSPIGSPSPADAPTTSLSADSSPDAQTTTLPADSPTNQTGNFYIHLQPYSQGDVIPCVIDGGTICTQRGTVDKANACMIDDDLLKVRDSVSSWCSMYVIPLEGESEAHLVLCVGEHCDNYGVRNFKQVHIKSSGPEIKIKYDDHSTGMWVNGRSTWKDVTMSTHHDYSDWVMYVPEEYVTGGTMPVFKSLQRFDREPKPVREARANHLATQGAQGMQDSASICE